MDTTSFDRLVASLGATSSRRGAVKVLGLAAGGGLAGAFGRGAAAAKRRKKKRKPPANTPGDLCPPGTLVKSVNVPADGTTAFTPNLVPGQPYRLRAVGYWSTNAEYGNDAFAAFKFGAPGLAVTEFEGTRLGLSVDYGSPDDWGRYTANHVYERVVTGRGAALSLRFTDPVTADNAGVLTVDVFCA